LRNSDIMGVLEYPLETINITESSTSLRRAATSLPPIPRRQRERVAARRGLRTAPAIRQRGTVRPVRQRRALPALVCLRPLLIKTGGKHAVIFRGQLFSRHRSLKMAHTVRVVIEAHLV
jgi:hypothetical protein